MTLAAIPFWGRSIPKYHENSHGTPRRIYQRPSSFRMKSWSAACTSPSGAKGGLRKMMDEAWAEVKAEERSRENAASRIEQQSKVVSADC